MVLVIPFAFMVGTAGAIYVGDGAIQNGTYGDWDITDYGVCVTGIKIDGTLVIDASKTSRPDCLTVTFPNDASLTTSALCTGDSDANGGSHYWASTCVADDGTRISLNGLDRTATNCDKRAKALGKASGALTSKCTGSWEYTGPAGTGAPGFCYTRVELTGAGYDSTTCPTATPGYVWDTTHSSCDFSYGIIGYADANITKKNGTAGPVRGTPVNLNGYTQGQCLVEGYSWSTGTTKSGTTTVATTSPSTIAVATGTRAGCLECHNSVSQRNSYAERWKETYLLTGHKNMLRKVTPGMNWAGPDGHVYTGAAGGQTLDFTAGTANGTYGTKTLMYLFGDWMAPAPDGLDTVVDMGGGVAKYNGTSTYSCAACHTTGWSNSTAGLCSLSSKTTQATCESAGGTWYPSTGIQGTTGAEPLASHPSYTSGITGKWDKDGILCSRCHASTFPAVAGTSTHTSGTPIFGQNVNNLCLGCHQGIAKTTNGTGADADLNLDGKIPVKNAATAPAYVPEYNGHVIGNQFLNSPHAKFTGTITPNKLGKYDLTTNDMSQYASTFNGWICRSGTGGVGTGSILKTYVNPSNGAAEIIKTSADCSTAGGQWVASGGSAATQQGSCTTCHDVHQSMVPEVGAAEPLVRECTTCHVDQVASYPALSAIIANRHPAGAGTPREHEATAPASPCEICHMPKATSGGFPSHLVRISVDPAYSTFPTSAEFLGNTKKIANTAPDGTFTNAVWTDLDLSCGQCHGSGGSAHLISKGLIATYAGSMHTAGSISATCADCHNSTTTAHPTGTNTPTQCSDCHATTRAGVKPTVEAACITCHASTGTASHQFTGAQITTYAAAIHAGGSAPSATCTVCHTEIPPEMINHPKNQSQLSCTDCHARPGVVPTFVTACNPCHGGSAGMSGVRSGTHFISANYLAKFAVTMHKNAAPKASMTLVAEDSNPNLVGIQVKINATVQVIDTSTDINDNLSLIRVNWGDNSSVTIMAHGDTANHAYTKTGNKTITLTATDLKGLKSTVRNKITVIKQ
jgi:hypothetical protein